MPRAHHNRAAIADPRPASIGSNLMRGSGAWASRMPARRLRAVRQQAKATDTKKESTSSAQSGRLLSLHGTLTAIPLPSGDEAANRAGRPESGVVGWSAATERQRSMLLTPFSAELHSNFIVGRGRANRRTTLAQTTHSTQSTPSSVSWADLGGSWADPPESRTPPRPSVSSGSTWSQCGGRPLDASSLIQQHGTYVATRSAAAPAAGNVSFLANEWACKAGRQSTTRGQSYIALAQALLKPTFHQEAAKLERAAADRRFLHRLVPRDTRKHHAAARLLQALFRGHQVRQWVKAMTRASKVLQAVARMRADWLVLQRQRTAAVRIQALGRGRQARVQYKRWQAGAAAGQRLWRGKAVRAKVWQEQLRRATKVVSHVYESVWKCCTYILSLDVPYVLHVLYMMILNRLCLYWVCSGGATTIRCVWN